MSKEFYSLEEIQKYYDKKSNTYVFKENDEYIDLVIFNFDLNVIANIIAKYINANDIKAHNINVWDIKAHNINAWDIISCDIKAYNIIARDINAYNIIARDISYHAVCFAYNNIKCKTIKGGKENSKHFVLDGKIEVEE